MAKMTNRTRRVAAYPHHFNGNGPKPVRSWCNPQKRLYVKVRGDNGVPMIVQTRPAPAEALSAVAP
jgi:hypothetical protein